MTTSIETLETLEPEIANAIDAVQALLDATAQIEGVDQRALAVARTNLETGLLWVANAAGGESILS